MGRRTLRVCGSVRERERLQEFRELDERQPRHVGEVETRERDGERFSPQTFAATDVAIATKQILRDAFFHERTLRVCKRLENVSLGAGKRALIARFFLTLKRAPHFGRRVARVDGNGWLFVREEQPIALFLG